MADMLFRNLNAIGMMRRSLLFAQRLISNDREMAFEKRMRLRERFRKSGIKAHGKSFPISYIPVFCSLSDISYFERIIRETRLILDKMTLRFISDARYRKIFKMDERLERMILIPSDSVPISPVGRIDIFFDGKAFKICEVNTDGTGGMSRADAINRMILCDGIIDDFHFDGTERGSAMAIASELVKYYASNARDPKPHPFIAIADFREEGVFSDFDHFAKIFRTLGAKARFVDVRDMKRDGKRLVDGKTGEVIDAVYRRAVSSVVASRIDECADLIWAAESGCALLMGDFRTTLMHSKSVSAAVFHPETLNSLTLAQREFVDKAFPETFFLDSESIPDSVMSRALRSKDKWVLKPQEGFASKGVVCGKDVSDDEWKMHLSACMDNGYMLQKFCDSLRFPVLRLDGDRIESVPVMFGAYYSAAGFAGLYNRAGARGIIDFEHDGVYYPSVYER